VSYANPRRPEVAKLEAAFGEDCLTSRTLELEKRYEPETFGDIPIDEPKVLKYVAQRAGCARQEVAPLGEFKTAKTLHDHIAVRPCHPLRPARIRAAPCRRGRYLSARDIALV
jgi:hypothetical protein